MFTDSYSDRIRGMSLAPSLTIIIPTRGRLRLLKECLDSVFAAELPEQTELLIVRNGFDPVTEDYLERLSASDSRVTAIGLPETSPAEARNVAVLRAKGDIIYFLDDDVTVAPDLFARALDTFAQRPDVDVIGGPNLTPMSGSSFEQCVGYVLASPFGSASIRARYRSAGHLRSADDRSLILCNLAIRRSALLDRDEVFGRNLVCNEENIMLGRMAMEGSAMLHDPALVVYHARRETVAGFMRQTFKYGRGRWQNTVALPSSLSPIFLIPSLFLFYLISLPWLRRPWGLIPLIVYVALLAAFAAFEAFRSRSLRVFPPLLVLFPACHLAYGAGLVWQCALSVLPSFGLKARSEARAS